MGMTLEQLRGFLPAAQEYRYLNYAATAPLLVPSADAMAGITRQNCEPMSKHFDQWLALIEASRAGVARTIGAGVDEIAFTANTSMGLSIIAASIDWKPGDRVIYPADEFPSNRFVWENLKAKGVRTEAAALEVTQDLLGYLKSSDLRGVRLIAFSAISYIDGHCIDVKAVAEFCHGHGILVAVDAIQAVGAVAVDVSDWGCDFLACGGQKWLLGPVGSGFLYVKSDVLKTMFVPLVGWASSRNAGVFDAPVLEFVEGARRLEPGLPDVAAIAGLAKSIEILSAVDWINVFDKIEQHQQLIRRELLDFGYVPLRMDGGNSGIVTINIDNDAQAEQLHQALDKECVMVTQSRRFNRRQLRVSAHALTPQEDIDAFLNVMRKYRPAATSSVFVPVSKTATLVIVNGQITKPLGKRALILGATRGLGEAMAKGLAKRGYDVTLLGRDQNKLKVVAAGIEYKFGVKTTCIGLDLTDRAAVDQWLKEHPEELNVDVLINNAAAAQAGLFATADLAQTRAMFEVNYFAPAAITQKAASRMIKKAQGHILNIVTSGARCALPMFASYSSSKGALWAWSEALGREFFPHNITVTTFLPPHMESALQRQLGRTALSYYRLQEGDRLTPVDDVADQALRAMFAGKSTVMPLATRLKLAYNVLMPDQIAKQVHRRTL